MRTLLIATFIIISLKLGAAPIEPSEEIRRWVENKTFEVDGQRIFGKKSIPEFYLDRGFEPAWTNDDNIAELIEQIKRIHEDGLEPEDYHLSYFMSNISTAKKVTPVQDILLTDAYLLLTSHLISGKVNAKTIDPEWIVSTKDVDLKRTLNHAVSEIEVARSINSLKPKYETYMQLKKALAKYRDLKEKGGWQPIAAGETIKPGDTNLRVQAIRKRLAVTEAYQLPNLPDSLIFFYDEELAASVKDFQKKHGLASDGAIGKGTLSAMNFSVDERIDMIIVNLERCRWLPTNLGKEHIIVNIANFELQAVKDGKTELRMNVVVGKPFRKTPVFSEKLRYLVFNPYWTVPPTILSQDILPAVRKNPNYLNSINIKVVNGDQIIDPKTINWATTTPRNFPYQLRQEPGLNNALGIVKFIFPNPYNVYMHDTNHRELFGNTDRALSSGCIRLSRPKEMAAYILNSDTDKWDEKRVDDAIRSSKNLTMMIKKDIMVHLLYWTAFVDENGNTNFRLDIYDRDTILRKALLQDPPSI